MQLFLPTPLHLDVAGIAAILHFDQSFILACVEDSYYQNAIVFIITTYHMQNYKHPPIDHKDDKLDDGPGIRSRHVESSRENNPNMGTISSDTKAPRECKGDPSNQDLSHSYSQHYMVCTAAVLGLCALLCIVYIACGLL